METINTQTNNYKMSRQPGRERLTVLIVDKKQINTVLEKDIMSYGNRVIVAECHQHAIQAATSTHNDLITISMNLTDRDSMKMVLKIKDVVGSNNFVSSNIYEDDTRQRENEKQVLYYIKKPLEVSDIQSILEQISRKKMFIAPLPN